MRLSVSSCIACIMLSLLSAVVCAETAETLNGTVTGPDGKPVDGAVVSVYVLRMNPDYMTYEVECIGQAKTCSSGLFSQAISESLSASAGMAVMCYAEKPGLSIGFTFVHAENAMIRMTAPHALSGRIEDARGNPVHDARVQLLVVSVPGDQLEFAFGLDPIPFFTAQTDEQGLFSISNLPENCTAEFLVKKPGLAPFHSLTSSLNPQSGCTFTVGQEDIALTLPDPCTVTGIVIDSDHQPVGGVKVLTLEQDIPANFIYSPVQTNDDGTFTLTDISPGTYTLTVASPDWLGEPVTVDVRKAVGVSLKVGKGTLLTVNVMDGVTDKPIPKAQVHIAPQVGPGSMMPVNTSDDDGKVQKRLAPGVYNVSAYASGYRSGRSVAAVVEEGQPADVTIILGATARITGTVLGPDGKPHAGVQIAIIPSSGAREKSSPVTDEQGRFSIGWDPTENNWTQGEYYMTAMHKEKNLAVVEAIDAETKEVQLTLRPGQTITGKVVDPDGKPIADAGISLQFSGSNWSTSFEGSGTRTDAGGIYTVTGIPADQRYVLSISGPKGYGTGSERLDHSEGEDLVTVSDIALKPANLTVSGTVVDVDGNAMEGIRIQCHGTGQPSVHVTTDKEGKFVFDAVCEGPLRLNAWQHKGGETLHANVTTEGGAQDITVVLAPQSSGSRYSPKRPTPLAGRELPDLSVFGLDLAERPSAVLVCVWDWRQRPSRHMVQQLAASAETFPRSVQVVLLAADPADRSEREAWLTQSGISLACGVIEGDVETARLGLGVQALPWLILTDSSRTVIAEGFSFSELTPKLDAVK